MYTYMKSWLPKHNLSAWHWHCKPILFGMALMGIRKGLLIRYANTKCDI